MQLQVNGVGVGVKRIYFEGGGGHILQLLVDCDGGECPGLFRELDAAFRAAIAKGQGGGVMSKDEVVGDTVEIRILQGLELQAIDIMRMYGFGVAQLADEG